MIELARYQKNLIDSIRCTYEEKLIGRITVVRGVEDLA